MYAYIVYKCMVALYTIYIPTNHTIIFKRNWIYEYGGYYRGYRYHTMKKHFFFGGRACENCEPFFMFVKYKLRLEFTTIITQFNIIHIIYIYLLYIYNNKCVWHLMMKMLFISPFRHNFFFWRQFNYQGFTFLERVRSLDCCIYKKMMVD